MPEKPTYEELEKQVKSLEKALAESENRFRVLLKNSSDIQVIVDERGVERYVSESVEAVTGYPPGEYLGKSGFVFSHPDDVEVLKRSFQTLRERKSESVRAEYRHRKKDGSWLHLEAVGMNLLDDPAIRGLVLNVRDVTREREAEKALQASEERYRSIMENIQEGYYEVDIAGNFTFCNEALCNIFGYERDEMTGQSYREFRDEPNARKVYTFFNKVYNEGRSREISDWEIIRKDGAVRVLETSASLIRDAEGNRVGFRGIVRDVTEEKLVQDQLRRAEKMETVGTLAGGVAHDLNNLLSGIVSYPELLLLQLPADSPLRKPLTTIQKSGEKAVAVVQDLLTLARRSVMSAEPVDLNRVVTQYLSSPEYHKINEYHPDVRVEARLGETKGLAIMGSPTHLSKTVMNLVSNAVEAMPEGGRVVLSTGQEYVDRPVAGYDHVKEGDYITLSVSDTGTGISPEHIDKIFEPFYTKKIMGRSGTGLGMAVVWGTVKDHNGFIDVQSREGEGTTFKLYFPVTREASVTDISKVCVEDYRGEGELILVIDDVAQQREVASGMLTQLGYEVHSVSSGEAAFEYLKDHKADLLVLDMIMDQGMDGLETYRKITELHPHQKALIASGFSETDRVKEAQRLGAGRYIKKPFLMETLGMAVMAELAGRG